MAQICNNIKTSTWPISGMHNVDSRGDWQDEESVKNYVSGFSLTKMYVNLQFAPGVGKKRRFTVYKNGLPTAMSVTISDLNTTGFKIYTMSFTSDMTDSVYVVDELIDGATENAFSIGFCMRTTIDKQVILGIPGDRSLSFGLAGHEDSIMESIGPQTSRAITVYTNFLHNKNIFSTPGTLKNFRMRLIKRDEDEEEGYYPDDTDKKADFTIKNYDTDATPDEEKLFASFYYRDNYKENSLELDMDQGQLAYFHIERDGYTSNAPYPKMLMEYYPDNPGHRLVETLSTTNLYEEERYALASGNDGSGSAEAEEYTTVIPTSGTIKNLIVQLGPDDPVRVGNDLTVTVRKNKTDTLLEVVLTNPEYYKSDLVNSFSVEAGDVLSFYHYCDDDPGNFRLGLTFVADDVLESPLFLNTGFYDPTDSPSAEVCYQGGDAPAGYCQFVEFGEVRKMVDTVLGLDHLEGETVSIQTDGGLPVDTNGVLVTNEFVVSGGQITLPSPSAVVHAGLPYDGVIRLLKASDGSRIVTGQTKQRRPANAALRLLRSLGLKAGMDEDNLDAIFDTVPIAPLFTGDQKKFLNASWDDEVEFVIKQDVPLPAMILAIIQNSVVEEKI